MGLELFKIHKIQHSRTAIKSKFLFTVEVHQFNPTLSRDDKPMHLDISRMMP